MQEVYDKIGRLKYNPFYHVNQGTLWSESDLEYLCKYAEIDGLKKIALALGRTETTVGEKISQLRRNGKYEYYKNLNRYW